MIHVLTVHWQDDRWVDLQLEHLRRHLGAPFKTYAFLNYLPADHSAKFNYASTEPIELHAIKLDLLADIASANADGPDDILIFIDGDAFPIRPLGEMLIEGLKKHPLVAVQRLENSGDPQPHPCFCVTTVKFWHEIGGNWHPGHTWTNPIGEQVTDVGGNLLGLLQQKNISWQPILRSNAVNLHPLWFGIYGGLVYHHGAGFRVPVSRHDTDQVDKSLRRLLPAPAIRALKQAIKSVPFLRQKAREARDNSSGVQKTKALSDEVFGWIQDDPEFYRRFEKLPEA